MRVSKRLVVAIYTLVTGQELAANAEPQSLVTIDVDSKGAFDGDGPMVVRREGQPLGVTPLAVRLSRGVLSKFEMQREADSADTVHFTVRRVGRHVVVSVEKIAALHIFAESKECKRLGVKADVTETDGATIHITLLRESVVGPECRKWLLEVQKTRDREANEGLTADPTIGPSPSVKVSLKSEPDEATLYALSGWRSGLVAVGKTPRTLVFELHGSQTVFFKKGSPDVRVGADHGDLKTG